jgi:hypothetical protein
VPRGFRLPGFSYAQAPGLRSGGVVVLDAKGREAPLLETSRYGRVVTRFAGRRQEVEPQPTVKPSGATRNLRARAAGVAGPREAREPLGLGVSRLPFSRQGITPCEWAEIPRELSTVSPSGHPPQGGRHGTRRAGSAIDDVPGPWQPRGGGSSREFRRYHGDAPARSSAGRLPLNRKRAAAPFTGLWEAG